MDSNSSRPPSVDSINLGSTYSGFYPTNNSHHYHHQQQTHQTNHSSIPYQSNQYPVQYPVYPAPSNGQQAVMPPPQQYGGQPYPAEQPANQQPLSYHYSLSASAAAAAYVNFQQSQHPQQQPAPAMNRHFQPIDPQQTTYAGAQWPAQYPGTQGPYPSMPVAPGRLPANQQSYSQYYSQYYLEYYRQLLAYQRQQQQAQVRKKTPLKYGSSLVHARAAFSQFDNQLLVVEPNSRIAIYSLQEIFTEFCYPHLFLQTLLLQTGHDNSLTGDDPNVSLSQSKTLLPFSDSNVALDWIRIKLLNDTNMNYELKLILKVITMLIRQNGVVSGLDLSELLFELISGGTTNDSNNDNNTEKMSQTGSSEVAVWREQHLQPLRQMLMRGQRRMAITYAQNNSLFDHALALSYLTTFQTSNSPFPVDNGLMLSTIRKFISSSLSTTDPLYVYYSHLIQIATNVINSSNASNLDSSMLSTQTLNAKIDSLESFIILLANEIKFEKVEIANNSLRNLIDLMVALLKQDCDYVLPDELFHDRLDCLLVNECLEFARFAENRQNSKLILRKLEFAFELFDYGFIEHSVNYCQKVICKFSEPNFNVCEFKQKVQQSALSKSSFEHFLLLGNKSEEEDLEFFKQLWSYQMNKIFTRQSTFERQFDSPLFKQPEIEEEVDEPTEDADDEEEEDSKEEETEELDEETTAEEISEASQVKLPSPVKKQPVKPAVVEQPKQQESKSEPIVSNKNDLPASNQSAAFSKKPVANSTLLNESGSTPVLDRSATRQPSEETHESLPFSPINLQQQQPPPKPVVQPLQNPLRETKIINNSAPVESQPQFAYEQPLLSRKSLPTSMEMNFQAKPSQFLSSIQESEKQEQLNNTQTQPMPSQSQSFDYYPSKENNVNTNTFRMDSLQNALPSNDSIDTGNPAPVNTFQPIFNPSLNDSGPYSGSFDFISTNGQVTSIPAYDPVLKDDSEPQAPNASQYNNHTNNEFLQNYKNPPPGLSSKESETKKDSTDSSKNSPSKANNGGLLQSLFGRLRPKNQAILPDDTDPQLVFDPATKRWVDKTSGDSGNQEPGLPPPPKIPFAASGSLQRQHSNNSNISEPNQPASLPSVLPSSLSNPPPSLPRPSLVPNGATSPFSVPSPPAGNAFRGNIRMKRYIDVFNQPSKS